MDFDGTDNQVQDDPRFHDYNLDAQIEQFVKNALDQAAHTRTNHIMWAMGCVLPAVSPAPGPGSLCPAM